MGDVTRVKLVTILWRYAGSPMLMDYEGLSGFSDVSEISGYAMQAMLWAHEQGLVQGDGARLTPKAGAARAQVAAILQRFIER